MIKKNNKTVGFIYKNNQNIDKIYKNNQLIFEQGFVREDSGNVPLSTTYQAIGKNLKDYKIYGNSVQGKLPDIYQQVEYIGNTGTQYIDTEFTPDYTKNIEIKIVFEPTVSDSRYCLLSNFAVADNLSLEVKENKGRVSSSIGNSDSTIGTVSTSTKNTYLFNYDVINKKYTLTVNNQSVNGNMNATGISGGSMLVFVDQSKRFYLFRNSIKIYNLKISENGILIRNFIPCYRKSDNEIGLYDIVNNVFYTNQGTEEFLKGSNAPTPSVPIEIESMGDKTKNLFNYKTASTQKGSFDNNGVFHATDNDNRNNLIYKIQLYNNNTMVTNSSRNISITGTGTYRITSPELIQSGTTKIRFANNGDSSEFSINCDIDGSQFVGQYASIVFTVDDATVGASVISDIMFYVGNEPFDYEPYGYKIPVIVGNTTTNIYLDEPLRKIGDYSDYIDFRNQKEFRNVIVNDDTGTQTIENSYTGTTDSSGTSISLPNIPTIKGTTIFEIDTEIQPSSMYIKYKSK